MELAKQHHLVEILDVLKNKSYKGAKNIPKQILNKKEKISIIYGRDRYGNTINFILQTINNKSLESTLSTKLASDTLLCTDKKEIYFDYMKQTKFKHGYIDITSGEKVKKEIIHINNVDKYEQSLTKWMKRFRGVATKYLENYLSWYRGLEEYDMKPSAKLMLKRSIS